MAETPQLPEQKNLEIAQPADKKDEPSSLGEMLTGTSGPDAQTVIDRSPIRNMAEVKDPSATGIGPAPAAPSEEDVPENVREFYDANPEHTGRIYSRSPQHMAVQAPPISQKAEASQISPEVQSALGNDNLGQSDTIVPTSDGGAITTGPSKLEEAAKNAEAPKIPSQPHKTPVEAAIHPIESKPAERYSTSERKESEPFYSKSSYKLVACGAIALMAITAAGTYAIAKHFSRQAALSQVSKGEPRKAGSKESRKADGPKREDNSKSSPLEDKAFEGSKAPAPIAPSAKPAEKEYQSPQPVPNCKPGKYSLSLKMDEPIRAHGREVYAMTNTEKADNELSWLFYNRSEMDIVTDGTKVSRESNKLNLVQRATGKDGKPLSKVELEAKGKDGVRAECTGNSSRVEIRTFLVDNEEYFGPSEDSTDYIIPKRGSKIRIHPDQSIALEGDVYVVKTISLDDYKARHSAKKAAAPIIEDDALPSGRAKSVK